MPCSSSDGMGYNSEDIFARRRLDDLLKKNNELTEILCSVLRSLDDANIPIPVNAAAWYHDHRKWDKSQGRP